MTMSDEHKRAMSTGMAQAKAIRNYLDAINSPGYRRRKPRKSAADLEQELREATDPVARMLLRPQLRAALEAEAGMLDMNSITAEFVKHALAYSERFGLLYADWREEGVPASVLQEAGLRRNR